MPLARRLADELLGVSYRDIPEADVHQVKRLLLDSFACIYGATGSASISALERSMALLEGPSEATSLSRGRPTSALNAVLLNGAMLRFLDMNDVQTSDLVPGPRHGHNSEILPLVLALCERGSLPGSAFIAAAWVGYEIATRFTESIEGLSLEQRGWNLDLRASFVTPFVAGRLMGMDAGQVEHAVGIALSRGLLLQVIDHGAEQNSMAKNLRFPMGAHLGLVATYMASQGVTGPERCLEGHGGFIETVMQQDFDTDHLEHAGMRSCVMRAAMKRFAACFATHGHLAATQELVGEHNLMGRDIASVEIRTSVRGAEHTGDPARRHPDDKETADHSSYFVQAAMIVDRQLGPEQFSEQRLQDPEIRRLAELVTIVGDGRFDPIYPAAQVRITLTDGRVLQRSVTDPPGRPSRPLSDADIEDKLRRLAGPVLSRRTIEHLVDAVWRLDELGDIRDLTAIVAGRDDI